VVALRVDLERGLERSGEESQGFKVKELHAASTCPIYSGCFLRKEVMLWENSRVKMAFE